MNDAISDAEWNKARAENDARFSEQPALHEHGLEEYRGALEREQTRFRREAAVRIMAAIVAGGPVSWQLLPGQEKARVAVELADALIKQLEKP